MSEEKTIKLTAREQWQVFKRLFAYVAPHKKEVAIAMTMLLLSIAGGIAGPLIIQRFIDDFITPMQFPKQETMTIFALYVGITLMLVVSYFQMIRFQHIALKIIQQMRIDVFTKVQGLGMRYFDATPAGSIVSRVTNDTESIKEMFVSVIVTFISTVLTLIDAYVALFF